MSARLGAVVLAAGQSRRMGQPKMLLPWGQTTVIGQVIVELGKTREPLSIVVVTGKLTQEIQTALQFAPDVQVAHNPDYEDGEMLSSLQVGLARLPEPIEAALVVLGDQPQIQVAVADRVISAYRESGARLVAPSYQMRRGHPWLVERSLWPEMMAMPPGQTMRDFLERQRSETHFVVVNTPSILKDLDTPEDYRSEKPPDRL